MTEFFGVLAVNTSGHRCLDCQDWAETQRKRPRSRFRMNGYAEKIARLSVSRAIDVFDERLVADFGLEQSIAVDSTYSDEVNMRRILGATR
jgi:hypothetical protein